MTQNEETQKLTTDLLNVFLESGFAMVEEELVNLPRLERTLFGETNEQ